MNRLPALVDRRRSSPVAPRAVARWHDRTQQNFQFEVAVVESSSHGPKSSPGLGFSRSLGLQS